MELANMGARMTKSLWLMGAGVALCLTTAVAVQHGFQAKPSQPWLAYDMAQIGPRALPKDAKFVQQERSYGSPIWVGSR